ncbi:MAG: signal peptide peptidase SppA, partial [Thermodesulfobacteriota bacterium]
MKKFFLVLLALFILFIAYSIGTKRGSSGGFSLMSGNKVAVLNIQDVIFDSDKYLESLNKIRKNKSIKAIVVRINSPGGAVGPSQEIYGELENIKSKLPVVASMGSVAASGGYYIACAADTIYANPGTITGSIGVIAQFLSYKDLLEWAKIDVEVIKSGEFKDVGSPLRTMNEEEKKYMQNLIDNVHEQFKTTVEITRGINKNRINEISDGKIFSGEQALNLKLVDELGNLNDAISYAAEQGGIKGDPEVVHFPKKKS